MSADTWSGGPPQGRPDGPFLLACQGRPVPHTPVWFMRQAGRSLPEYRALREGVAMLESCFRPDMVVEITMQPVRRYGVDAAILFSDIMVPLAAAGLGVDIKPGVGPVIAEPVRTEADLDRLRPPDESELGFIAEAVPRLTAELGEVPLIGFAGAPFTMASYLVEGGPSRTYARTKALMHGDPGLWFKLCQRLTGISGAFLAAQIRAGVAAVQVFDSWAGALSEADYAAHVAPHTRSLFAGLPAAAAVPHIHYGLGTGHLLAAIAGTGPTVVGVDWRTPLDEAARLVGPGRAVQGNLDPALLLADWDTLSREVDRVLAAGQRAPSGHIFNLGHGVLPDTDPDMLARVVEHVHKATTR